MKRMKLKNEAETLMKTSCLGCGRYLPERRWSNRGVVLQLPGGREEALICSKLVSGPGSSLPKLPCLRLALERIWRRGVCPGCGIYQLEGDDARSGSFSLCSSCLERLKETEERRGDESPEVEEG